MRIIIMSKVLMKIRLTMNKEYSDHGTVYTVDVTSIDKAGFHGYYEHIGFDGERWNSKGTGLFRWEHIGHMEKISV